MTSIWCPRSARPCTVAGFMARHPGVFPSLYVSIVRIGEATGTLEQSFLRLGQHLERSELGRRLDPAPRQHHDHLARHQRRRPSERARAAFTRARA